MVSSDAASVDQYIAELTSDRAIAISTLRKLILDALPSGYEEVMAWGMIGYQVPMEISGPTYNNQPIGPVAIASQKQHISLYLLAVYASEEVTEEFQNRWRRSGKRLNMGKSCIRFTRLENADLDTIRWAVGLFTPEQFTDMYIEARKQKRGRPNSK